MELTNFAGLMAARGCTNVNEPSKRRFVGTYAGHPFSVVYMSGAGKMKFNLYFVLGRNFPFAQVLRQLKDTFTQRFEKRVSVTQVPPNQASQPAFGQIPRGAMGIIYTFIAQDELVETVLDTSLGTVMNATRQTGAFTSDECPVCHGQGCDAFGINGFFYRPVHAACIQQKSVKTFDQVKKNEHTGSYALGAVGALLGAIVGAIPTILSISLLNRISAWLTMLIPMVSYFGYKLLRGKMTKISTLFVLISSILAAPISLYFAYAIIMQKEYHRALTFKIFSEIIKAEPKDFVLTLIFTGLGILFSLGIILKGNKSTWNMAAAEVASLRPINPPQQPQPQPTAPAPSIPPMQSVDPPAPPMLGQ